MRIKPSKNILILPIALFFMHVAHGQLSQNVFLQRTSISFGIGFSKLVADSIYDQDLGRMCYGVNYTHPMNDDIDIDFGVMYNQRGGKSFNEGTLQSFGFIDMPIRFSIGGSVERVENITYESRRTELDLVRLKSGYVIVCLSDRQTQSDYYQSKGDTAQARMILKDAAIKNKSLKEAFIEHYKYSKVVFIDVKDLANVCNGSNDAQIEDVDGNKVSIETIKDEFFVFFKPGSIYGNVSTFNKSGYEFVDKNCEKLEDPFPSDEFFMSGQKDNMNRMIKELNRRLESREATIRTKRYFSEDLLDVVY
jgi:hypothetical protein